VSCALARSLNIAIAIAGAVSHHGVAWAFLLTLYIGH
jgi:hypothetical protein